MKHLKSLVGITMTIFSHIATAECIFTPEDFDKIRMNLNGDYQLCADIDMAEVEFAPIGSSSVPFTGTFNGLGHTIRNLDLKEQGIFRFVQGTVVNPASIKALLLDNITLNLNGGAAGVLFGESRGSLIIENIALSNATLITSERLVRSIGGLGGRLSAHPSDSWEDDTVTFRQIKLDNILFECTPDRIYENAGGLFGAGDTDINYVIDQISANKIFAEGCASIRKSGFLTGLVQSSSKHDKTIDVSMQNIGVQNSIFSADELEYVATFGYILGDDTTYNLNMQNISLSNNSLNAFKNHYGLGWLIGHFYSLRNPMVTVTLQKIVANNNHMQISCGHNSGLIGMITMNGEEKNFLMSELDLQSNVMWGDYPCYDISVSPASEVGFLIGYFKSYGGIKSNSIISNAKVQNSSIHYRTNEGRVRYVGLGFGSITTNADDNLLFEHIYLIDNKMQIQSEDIREVGGIFGNAQGSDNVEHDALTIKHSASIGNEIILHGDTVDIVGGLVGGMHAKVAETFSMPSETGGGVYIEATDYIYNVGGFVGHMWDGSVEDSYTLLPLRTAAPDIRRIGGFNGSGQKGSLINRTYAISEFSYNMLAQSCIGEFVGGAGAIDSSFWLDKPTEPSPLPGAGCTYPDPVWLQALSGLEFMLGTTFSQHGWNIGGNNTIWNIDEGQSLPYLNFMPIPVGPGNKVNAADIQLLRDKEIYTNN